MAVWQYQMFLVPEEEINSFFKNQSFIKRDDLNGIDWWKYNEELHLEHFSVFKHLLSTKKRSWSNDIALYGEESSNCIEIILERNKIAEISVRIDLRYSYKEFVRVLCDFAKEHHCTFLNSSLKILAPNINIVTQDIENYPLYKSFLNKLNKK